MNSFWLLPASVLLDLSLGDPHGFPHPVRLMGKFARFLEQFSRKRIPSPFWAGAFTSTLVYSASFLLPWSLLKVSAYIHPFMEFVVSTFLIYTSIALKDLMRHSEEVYLALEEGNLEKARERVGRIVGRDTDNLTETEIVRAGVESVGESLVDGITAPLFFAAIGGPVWAVLYRSINTLDSLFGYKNSKYSEFGRLPARVDDLANYIPARITAPILSVSAGILGYRMFTSFKILFRDGGKHPSPNSGLSEAALAGALRVQLGGTNFYQGVPSEKPKIGDPIEELKPGKIPEANRIVLLTSLLTCGFFLFLEIPFEHAAKFLSDLFY